jgi:uncharacterized protein YjiS (DUF1127 family)
MEMIMSPISSTSAQHKSASSRILGTLAATPKYLWTTFIGWRVKQAALFHLHSMSDRELEDIGISRSQIECSVAGERARDRVFSRHY